MREFSENQSKLAGWFPSVEFHDKGTICYYSLDIGDALWAEVALYVERDLFEQNLSVDAAEWLIKVYSREDMLYRREFAIGGPLNAWANIVKRDPFFDESAVDTLMMFSSLLWSEIFMKRLTTHGIFVGSWVSGVILV